MARTKKKTTNQNENMRAQTVEEWLALGNKITICPPGMRSEDVEFTKGPRAKRGRRKKKTDQGTRVAAVRSVLHAEGLLGDCAALFYCTVCKIVVDILDEGCYISINNNNTGAHTHVHILTTQH